MLRFLGEANIKDASNFLQSGHPVVLPTETVYGIAAHAYSDSAISEVFLCKQRPAFNPLALAFSDLNIAEKDVDVTEFARFLADKFLPGPLTLILKRKKTSKVSLLCSAGLDTLGVRIPDNEITLRLLRQLNFPLALTSANISHGISPTSAEEAVVALGENGKDIPVIDGGACKIGIESTIVDLTQETPTIIRIGAIDIDMLEHTCGTKFVLKDKNSTKRY